MSNDLTASFELNFKVGSTELLKEASNILEKLDKTLEHIRRAVNPFNEFQEPIARATQVTTQLNEAVSRTATVTATAAEGATALGGALLEVGEGATQAATGLARMGAEAEETATRVSSAMERAQAAYRSAASMTNIPGGSGGGVPSGPGYFSRVGTAGRGFHDAIQTGFGSAFGAAAAGFGVLAPVHSAAEYDNLLTHIGITEQIPVEQNAAFSQALGRRIDRIAQQTGQRSADLVESASFLSMEGYSMDQINAFVPQIARISTAYNAHPDAVAKTAFALSQNFHLTEAQMPAGLTMVARVGKEAALPLEQLAPLFPEVAATAAQLGVTGLQGVADILSMTAVIRKNVGSEGKATTDMRQVMSTLTSNHGRRRFRELLGWDPRDVMHAAQDKGADPLSAIVDRIAAIPNARKRQDAISDLFVGMEDQTGASAMIRDFGQMMDIRKRIQNTSPEMLQKDFLVGLTSTLIRLNAFEDSLAQIERRVGNAFVPVLNVGTVALHGVANAFDTVNKLTGGAAKIAVTGAGAILGLTAALGALGAVLIPIKAGLGLVNAMTGGLLGRLAALGMHLLKLPFAVVSSRLIWLARGAALLVTEMTPIGWALTAVAASVTAGYFAWRNWDRIKPMLNSLGHWISGWSQWLGHLIMAPLHALDEWFDNSSVGHSIDHWLAHPAIPAQAHTATNISNQSQNINLHVSHDPSLNVRQTSGQRGLVAISPDRGRMIARP